MLSSTPSARRAMHWRLRSCLLSLVFAGLLTGLAGCLRRQACRCQAQACRAHAHESLSDLRDGFFIETSTWRQAALAGPQGVCEPYVPRPLPFPGP